VPDRQPPRAVARAVLAARRRLLRAADRLLPGEVALWEHSTGALQHSHVLGALARHGVADALGDGKATAAELAPRVGLHADTLHRVLRAAAVRGLVRLDRRGRFSLTHVGQALRADHPRSLKAWVSYLDLDSTRNGYLGLADALRTGAPPFPERNGQSVWGHFADHPDEEALFADAMRNFTELDAQAVADTYPFPEGGTVCDVAGGVGTLLAGVLSAHPGLSGVLVDAPGVLGEAEGYLEGRGVRDRVTLSEGDMFQGIEAEADVYLLKDILHDWDDERSLQILRAVREAMPPGSRVVLVETLQDRNEVEPITSMVDVHMLAQTDGGRQRSAGELRALLSEAGLRPGAVRHTPLPSLVEGFADR
jgi:O-methyltransferase